MHGKSLSNPVVNPGDKVEFERLTSVRDRARWLLARGVTVKPDIDTADLTLVWRAYAADVMLPGKYTCSEGEAIKLATEWLERKMLGQEPDGAVPLNDFRRT